MRQIKQSGAGAHRGWFSSSVPAVRCSARPRSSGQGATGNRRLLRKNGWPRPPERSMSGGGSAVRPGSQHRDVLSRWLHFPHPVGQIASGFPSPDREVQKSCLSKSQWAFWTAPFLICCTGIPSGLFLLFQSLQHAILSSFEQGREPVLIFYVRDEPVIELRNFPDHLLVCLRESHFIACHFECM